MLTLFATATTALALLAIYQKRKYRFFTNSRCRCFVGLQYGAREKFAIKVNEKIKTKRGVNLYCHNFFGEIRHNQDTPKH